MQKTIMIPLTPAISVHVIVLIAGLACLAAFLVLVTVLIVLVAASRRRAEEP